MDHGKETSSQFEAGQAVAKTQSRSEIGAGERDRFQNQNGRKPYEKCQTRQGDEKEEATIFPHSDRHPRSTWATHLSGGLSVDGG